MATFLIYADKVFRSTVDAEDKKKAINRFILSRPQFAGFKITASKAPSAAQDSERRNLRMTWGEYQKHKKIRF